MNILFHLRNPYGEETYELKAGVLFSPVGRVSSQDAPEMSKEDALRLFEKMNYLVLETMEVE